MNKNILNTDGNDIVGMIGFQEYCRKNGTAGKLVVHYGPVEVSYFIMSDGLFATDRPSIYEYIKKMLEDYSQ
jgi:hypothetical protein